jgi:serine/threonine protein kinase
MPVPATISDFLSVIRKSQQIDGGRLDDYLRQQAAGALPAKPRHLARQLVRDGLLTPFQAEQFLLGKYKGFTIGNYRVIDRLGTGGAGNVYLAEHQLMRRRVAIKVLPTPHVGDPSLTERFRREARAAALLDHPNIVRIYDFREEEAASYLVLEHIDGPSLQKVIDRRGAVPVETACEYARQVAHGLQHAHEQGLIHRDVKPANLLVDGAGVVKILDMGLARFTGDDEGSLTRKFNTSVVLGTADYLSPEQAMDLHGVDVRADLYSLGATLFALLAGRPPFHDGTLGQKLLWHQSRVPDRVDEVRPEVPAELADLVARLLAKSPDERPGSAAEVAEALAPWADEAPEPRPLTKSAPEILPGAPASDTLVSRSKDDTTPMPPKPRPALTPRLEAPPRRRPDWVAPLALAVGVTALVGGAVAALLLAL